MDDILSVECVSLNKSTVNLLWLTLEFFPSGRQSPSLSNPSQSHKSWGVTFPSPATHPTSVIIQSDINVYLHNHLKFNVTKNASYKPAPSSSVSINGEYHIYSPSRPVQKSRHFPRCFLPFSFTLQLAPSAFFTFLPFTPVPVPTLQAWMASDLQNTKYLVSIQCLPTPHSASVELVWLMVMCWWSFNDFSKSTISLPCHI